MLTAGINRVIHVVPGISREASGPSYSVVRLCQSLQECGNDVRLFTLDYGPVVLPMPFIEVFPVCNILPRLGFSKEMRRRLHDEADQAEIIHNHSLWMMPNVYPGWATRGKSCQLVISPRGTLSAWALHRSANFKRIFWYLFQHSAIRHASCFHVTADSEYQQVREAGLKSQPICVVPNGVDIPKYSPKRNEGPRKLLFLGRIHPTKGIDILLKAWQAVWTHFPDWELHIVGPDSGGYLNKMRLLADELHAGRVFFQGPFYGAAKWQLYSDAELFVLPTNSENFGMSVAEALASGTPAIVTTGAPWAGLLEQRSGWWIDAGIDPLIACMEEALAQSPESLTSRGQAGRDWMIRDFSWQRVGMMMHQTYQWLLAGGTAPDWIRLD